VLFWNLSYLGFIAQNVEVGKTTTREYGGLQEDVSLLDEVVVIKDRYLYQKRFVSSVSSDKIRCIGKPTLSQGRSSLTRSSLPGRGYF